MTEGCCSSERCASGSCTEVLIASVGCWGDPRLSCTANLGKGIKKVDLEKERRLSRIAPGGMRDPDVVYLMNSDRKLWEYLDHKRECPRRNPGPGSFECNCGLTEIMMKVLAAL